VSRRYLLRALTQGRVPVGVGSNRLPGIALASATLGYYLSFVYQLPTGPTMAALCALAWVPAALMRKR
jgi:hypothetical protein